MEPHNSKTIRQMLLSNKDDDCDPPEKPKNCHQLKWKKDHWDVLIDRDRIYKITPSDVPSGTSIRDNDFVFNALSSLKAGGLEALKSFLEGL